MNRTVSPHRAIIAKIASIALITSLLLGLALVSGLAPTARADYADGSGAGQYQDQIFWLDWQGFTFTNGASKTFDLPGGVTVTAVVSNLSGGAIHVGRPEDYGPAAMNHLYPNTGHTALNSCVACTNVFRLTFSADVGGASVPVDLVAIDAEAAAAVEYLKVTTDGNAWQILEQYKADNLRATFSNSDKTLELHGISDTPPNWGTALAVSTDVTNFDFELKGGGISAAALGVFLPFDYGDAPSSYDDAGHYMRQVFTGGDPGATKVYDPVSTAFTNFATISDVANLFMGVEKPDPDPGTQNSAPNATNALGDDNDGNDDEDALTTIPQLTRASSSYALDVSLHNASGSAANLYGWVDFDGDGKFAANEFATVSVANNSVTAHLSWPSISVTAPAGHDTYARLRLTTANLTDSGGTADVDERSIGSTTSGEVEDYAIPIPTDPIKEALAGCGVITFDSDAQGFRTASTHDNRSVADGPHNAPYQSGSDHFRWESAGGNPTGHLRADDFDGNWQEVWTPVLLDPDFSPLIDQQLQFDYKNDTGYNQYRLYVSVKGTNGSEYYFYFNDQLASVGSWSRVKVPMTASAFHTGFEANESPSSPPSSPAPSTAQFNAVMSSLDRISISVEGVSGSDTSRFDNFGRACDYGDAPESGTSYVTTGTDAARHNIAEEIRLGALIDSETDGLPTTAADGDDKSFQDDEDGVASFPDLVPGLTSYVVDVAVHNSGATPATLYGWIDFNSNGVFESSEAVTAAIPASTVATETLTWSNPALNLPFGSPVYARFRITTDTLADVGATAKDERAQGPAKDGEVEDYAIYPVGKIVVDKVTVPSNDAQSFAFSLTGGPDNVSQTFSLTDVATPHDSGALKTGTYNVAETLPAGWDKSSATCDDGSHPDAVKVDPGETVTCTFTNAKHANLTVVKEAVGDNGTFAFTSAALPGGDFTITTVGNTGSKAYTNLAIGTYDLAETVPAGWDLTSSSCDNGKTLPNIALAAGDNVTCTFTNTTLANLTVVKKTLGGDGSFDFTSTALPGGNFTIATTGATGNKAYANLALGTYDLAETVPAGWDLTDSVCDNGKTLPDVALAAGDDVTCTFTNAKRGEIQIKKQTSPAGGTGFGFTDDIAAPNSFSLDDGGTQTFSNVLPGQYTVTENDPAASNYELSGLTCTDADSTVDVPTRTATINVDPGETVVCTFTNTEDDTVTIEKITIPAGAPDDFFFNTDLGTPGLFTLGNGESRSYANVTPGSYRVQENNIPAGFDLTAIDCHDTASGQTFPGDLVNHSVDLTMTAGESVHCAFTNTQRGTIIMRKQTLPGGSPELFGYGITGPGISIAGSLDDGDADQVDNATPGTWVLDETIRSAGWDLTDITCTSALGSSTVTKDLAGLKATVELAPGDTVDCTFTNTQRGEIIVDKVTDPAADPQPFNFTLGGGPDSVHQLFTLTDASAPYTSGGLKPGSYNIAETLPAGWDLSSATCSDGSDPTSVQLDPNETVTCTFNNAKYSSIIMRKETLPDGSPERFGVKITGQHRIISDSLADGEEKQVDDAIPGAWVLEESIHSAGWELTDITCTSVLGSAVSKDLANFKATVDLKPGDTVDCTFSNTQDGEIQIKKNTSPAGGAGFGFTDNIAAPNNFTLNDGGTQTFSNVAPGQYTVTEDDPAASNYKLSGLTCADSNSSGDLPTRTATINVDPGERVVCTFTNTEDDTVTIEKVTIPAGAAGSFSFSQNLDGSGDFALGGGDSKHFTAISPGNYTVSEADPTPSFDLTAINCQDTAGTTFPVDLSKREATLNMTAGESVHCAFTNTQRGQIMVDKVTDPAGDPQAFDFTLSGGPDSISQSFALADADQPYESGYLKPGSGYSIVESAPGGWDLSSAACDDGSDPASIDLDPGEIVTCTFTNTKPGKIIVDKVTDPANDPQSFDFTLHGGPDSVNQSFALTDADAPRDSGDLKPGVYNVHEHLMTGWDLFDATCDDGSNPTSIDLAAGETVTCTFTNTKRANLTVVKKTVSGNGSFDFTSVALPGGNFTIATTGATGNKVYTNLALGTYDLAESIPAGWDLTGSSCDNGSTLPNVALAAGEDVTCSFTNAKRGEIQIKKNTSPAGGAGFGFTDNVATPNSFSLDDGGTQTFSNVLPGQYTITENDPAGSNYKLSGLTCADSNSTVDVRARTATINVDPGETVVCTFTNTQNDTVTIEKVTVPAGAAGSFSFSQTLDGSIGDFALGGGQSRHFTAVSPGSYTVIEADPTPGFDLTAIECYDTLTGPFSGNLSTRTAELNMTAGEMVHCAFTNTQRGKIIVAKVTDPAGDSQSFSFDLTGGPDSVAQKFSLTDVSAPHDSGLQKPGVYSVVEAMPSGWSINAATCSDGSDPASLQLDPGETVTCTFTNTKHGEIQIKKKTSPSGGTGFGFTDNVTAPHSFTLDDNGAKTFDNVPPGSYTVTENDPAANNYKLSGLTCTGSDSTGNVRARTATINVDPGETVVCTFTNVEDDTVTIEKVTIPAGAAGNFPFSQTLDGAIGDFALGGGQSRHFTAVSPGSYTVIEADPTPGFHLTAIDCHDTATGQTFPGDLNTRTVTLNMTAGESIHCAFTNTAQPTAISLVSFHATAKGETVELDWRTDMELDTLGFHIHRSERADFSAATRITTNMVASIGETGGDYTYTDADVTAGVRYFYWLVEVEIDGTTTPYGPATATVGVAVNMSQSIFLPLVSK